MQTFEQLNEMALKFIGKWDSTFISSWGDGFSNYCLLNKSFNLQFPILTILFAKLKFKRLFARRLHCDINMFYRINHFSIFDDAITFFINTEKS